MSGNWEKVSFPGSLRERRRRTDGAMGKPEELFGARMEDYTTIGIGGPVPSIVFPRSVRDVREILAAENAAGRKMLTLGAGSNLLVSDAGVAQRVVCLKKHMGKVLFTSDGSVTAEGGTMLPRFAVLCALSGLSGLERLSGIPGTVGGALTMNAGAYGSSIGELLDWVEVVDPEGKIYRFAGREIGFAYRHAEYPVEGVIVRARFRLAPAQPDAVFAVMKEYNERRRASQPWGERTFGSTFLRPPGGESAGALLERAGMKGAREGDVAFSQKHANFIVNVGKAKAGDVMRLIERGREAVRAMSGIGLMPEVKTWGNIT